MTFDQFFRILSARWLLAISVVIGITLLTLVICLLIPKSYKATASVMIDMKPDPVAGMSNMAAAPSASIMATQVDIITSPTVAMRVVRQVGMDSSPDVRKQWMEATGGKGDYLAWVGELISKNLDVKPSRESNIIDITYSSVDPKFAAILANAFAKAYMDSDVQFRVDPARQYYSFFEERARMAREKLEAAQTKLAQAQKERGILVTDERLDHESAKLVELSTQIVALRAAVADTSSRSAAAKNGADQMQDILNNSLIATLKSDLSRSEAKLEELSSHYGSEHPLVKETQANIDSTKARLALETRRLTKSLSINNTMTKQRENEAMAEYEEQRAKLLKLKDARTELAVLEREVESAQHVYDAIQARQSQMGLESNNNQNNVVLVTPATEPAKHYFPKITLSLALAMSLGSLISVIVVMGVELFDRRIRGVQDLIQGTGLPIVGVIPHPTSSKWSSRFRLTSKPVSSSVGLSVSGLSAASLESGRSTT
jgi:chain length determinant protein EpsF